MWVDLATVLAVFVGVAYAIATGSIQLSRRYQRALVVAVLVLLTVPIAAGAVAPVDGDESPDAEFGGDTGGLKESYDQVNDDRDADGESDDDELTGEEWYGRSPTDPETYDNGEHLPRIEHGTALESKSEAVAATAVDDNRLPTGNDSVDYSVAEAHNDAANVTVSYIESEVNGETLVPEARYHVDIDGVDETTSYQLGTGSYWGYDSVRHENDAHSFVTTGPYAGLKDGFHVDMVRVESTHVYFDVVTDDGEIKRFVVTIEADGVLHREEPQDGFAEEFVAIVARHLDQTVVDLDKADVTVELEDTRIECSDKCSILSACIVSVRLRRFHFSSSQTVFESERPAR